MKKALKRLHYTVSTEIAEQEGFPVNVKIYNDLLWSRRAVYTRFDLFWSIEHVIECMKKDGLVGLPYSNERHHTFEAPKSIGFLEGMVFEYLGLACNCNTIVVRNLVQFSGTAAQVGSAMVLYQIVLRALLQESTQIIRKGGRPKKSRAYADFCNRVMGALNRVTLFEERMAA